MAMHDEFERIHWLKARYELDGAPAGTVIGIGDDAAVLEEAGATVLTVDAQVEGTHFRRELLAPGDVGWRALVAAASDVFAMGALPHAALSALTVPDGYPNDDFEALIEGVAQAAHETGASVVGGNLSRADHLSVTTTVVGSPLGAPVARSGAVAGDTIYVTGTVGSAALGFRILDSGARVEGREAFVSRWRRPPSTLSLVKTLARVATACIDVSDGCLQDLGHLCRASNVGAIVQSNALPLDSGFHTACLALGAEPFELALTGGEDYELLFTAPRSAEADSIATAIGTTVESGGVRAVDADGATLPISASGFRHFSS
jgi:thiamine-monophosphate kinase